MWMPNITTRLFDYFECTISNISYYRGKRWRNNQYIIYHWKCCCCYISCSCGCDRHLYMETKSKVFSLIWFSNLVTLFTTIMLFADLFELEGLILGVLFLFRRQHEKKTSILNFYCSFLNINKDLYAEFSNLD